MNPVSEHSFKVSSFLPMPEDVPPEPESNPTWDGFMAVLTFTAEMIARVALPVILGVVAHFVLPMVAMPFFIFAAASVLTRIVVKIIDIYNMPGFNEFKETVSSFLNRYPFVQYIALLIGVALCPLSIITGSVVGGMAGTVNGFLMGIDIAKQRHQISREDDPETSTEATVVNA